MMTHCSRAAISILQHPACRQTGPSAALHVGVAKKAASKTACWEPECIALGCKRIKPRVPWHVRCTDSQQTAHQKRECSLL